jgi:hypothetical protein
MTIKAEQALKNDKTFPFQDFNETQLKLFSEMIVAHLSKGNDEIKKGTESDIKELIVEFKSLQEEAKKLQEQ